MSGLWADQVKVKLNRGGGAAGRVLRAPERSAIRIHKRLR
jgi:hypothetical protein